MYRPDVELIDALIQTGEEVLKRMRRHCPQTEYNLKAARDFGQVLARAKRRQSQMSVLREGPVFERSFTPADLPPG